MLSFVLGTKDGVLFFSACGIGGLFLKDDQCQVSCVSLALDQC